MKPVQMAAVTSHMVLPVDRYKLLEATDSCKSNSQSIKSVREALHIARSRQEMHQVRGPQPASAEFSSTTSAPARVQLLEQLTQAGMQKKQKEQECTTASWSAKPERQAMGPIGNFVTFQYQEL